MRGFSPFLFVSVSVGIFIHRFVDKIEERDPFSIYYFLNGGIVSHLDDVLYDVHRNCSVFNRSLRGVHFMLSTNIQHFFLICWV